MSKNINVNPGQYKVAGRERPGHDIAPKQQKQKESVKARELREQRRRKDKKRESAAPDK